VQDAGLRTAGSPAALLPLMDAHEYAALRDSIKEHGQMEPCVLHEGQILDGRHRWQACRELGIEPHSRHYQGECGSPTAFVLMANLHRRHLTPSQRAAIAVDVLPLFEAEAKERQRAAGQDYGRGQPEAKVTQRIGEPITHHQHEAAAQAATAMGSNRQYVAAAKQLKEKEPALFAAVKSGEKTIAAAALRGQ